MVEGAEPLPRKKSFFCPQIDNFEAVFNRHKPWDADFTVQSRNEAYKNSAKIIQKFMVRPRGRSHNRPPPEYATVEIAYYVSARVTV